MFGNFFSGSGGFQNSSSSSSDTGAGTIGGYQYGGINNGSRLPEWIPLVLIGLVIVTIIKK